MIPKHQKIKSGKMEEYKEDDESLTVERVKMDRKLGSNIENSDKNLQNGRRTQLTINEVSEIIEAFLTLIEQDQEDKDKAYSSIKCLRFYMNEEERDNTSKFFFSQNQNSSQTFAQYLYDIIAAEPGDPTITFSSEEEKEDVTENVIALMANLSMNNVEFSKGFFNLGILDLLLERFGNLYPSSIIHMLRLIYAIIGSPDDEPFGQFEVVKNFFKIFECTLFCDHVLLRNYSLSVLCSLVKFSKLLEDKFIEALIGIVLNAFDRELMDLRAGISTFFFNIACYWENAFPNGFEVFPKIINQGLSNSEDDVLLYYTLYLTKLTFYYSQKKGFNGTDLVQLINISSITRYFTSPFESVQIIALGAFKQIISDPSLLTCAFETDAYSQLLEVLTGGVMLIKRKAAEVICKAIEVGKEKASFLLDSTVLEAVFYVVDTIKNPSKAVIYARMLDTMSTFNQFQDVMNEIDGVEFLEVTDAFDNEEGKAISDKIIEMLIDDDDDGD